MSNTRLADAISQLSIVKMQLHCPKSSISGPKTTVHIPKLALYSTEYLQHNVPSMRYCHIFAEIERNIFRSFHFNSLKCQISLPQFFAVTVNCHDQLFQPVHII